MDYMYESEGEVEAPGPWNSFHNIATEDQEDDQEPRYGYGITKACENGVWEYGRTGGMGEQRYGRTNFNVGYLVYRCHLSGSSVSLDRDDSTTEIEEDEAATSRGL